MDVSTIVNIILCILSFILAVISVVTVVITLRQSNKMIEESTRPVISIYTDEINVGNPFFYLIVKNFGKSPAYIIEASNPVPTPLLGHRCRSSQEITGSPTPFSTSNHYLWICESASFSLSNPNIAA